MNVWPLHFSLPFLLATGIVKAAVVTHRSFYHEYGYKEGGAMTWEPCSDCISRLKQYERDISQQTHVRGLQELCILDENKDVPLRGNWRKLTRLQCDNCSLKWTRSEGNIGGLQQYQSSLRPEPTPEQKPFLGI